MKLRIEPITAALLAVALTVANVWSHSTLPSCSAEQVEAGQTQECAIRA